jgi:hypothetical protein
MLNIQSPLKRKNWYVLNKYCINPFQYAIGFETHILGQLKFHGAQSCFRNKQFLIQLRNSPHLTAVVHRSPVPGHLRQLHFVWWDLTFSATLWQAFLTHRNVHQFTYSQQCVSEPHRPLQVCGTSVRNLLHITLLMPRIWRLLLDF